MLNLFRTIIHLGCAVPLGWILFVLLSGDETALGSDPIKELEHVLGDGAIIIFCVMFLLGILLQLLRKNQYQTLRRPLGLWAFVWALLHLSSYLVLELGLDVKLFFSELLHRPYLILGAVAFSILLVMTITSLPSIKRALGQKWFSVHQLAYPALALAAIHYYWSVKNVTTGSVVAAVVVSAIILWRLISKKIARKG